MKNFQLNPLATDIDLTIEVSIQALEAEGFDFETYHEGTKDAKELESIETAREINYNEYIAVLVLRDDKTFVKWRGWTNNIDAELEATGDDEQTIKDIINMLEQSVITISDNTDMTTDKDGNYVSTFVEA